MAAAELKTRKLPCFIESFSDATAGLPSPEIFRRWTAIGIVAAALERRVWVATAQSAVFPNLYTLLVAPPGVGKSQAIAVGTRLLNNVPGLQVAPDDVTKASILDALEASHRIFTVPPKFMLEYHSMFVSADEFGVLVPAHDLEFLNVLNVLYDNRDRYKETRRSREKPLILDHPQLNILAGTQPDYLASLLPDQAWGMGTMTRIIMVYHGKAAHVPLFGTKVQFSTKDLQFDLDEIGQMFGEMAWTPEAEHDLTEWHRAGMHPVPEHSKLKHYNARRVLHILKLCMISSCSRGSSKLIEAYDVERAKVWLLEVESLMPEIFKEMAGKSDGQVIQDMHYYIFDLWVKNGKTPIHRSKIDLFLMNRTPAYNVENIVKTCVRAGILIDRGADLFIPGTTADDGYGGT